MAASVLCEAGWRTVGLDLSAGMLGVARRRLAPRIEAGEVRLLNADATSFALPSPVGACVCLDGALNHLESLQQLERCFGEVSRALLDGGQFVFDLLEPSHFRHWNRGTLIDRPDALLVKHGVWDDDAGTGWLRLTGALKQGGRWSRIEQTLSSRQFTPTEVAAALSSAGLVPAGHDIEDAYAGCYSGVCATSADPCRTIYRAVKRAAGASSIRVCLAHD